MIHLVHACTPSLSKPKDASILLDHGPTSKDLWLIFMEMFNCDLVHGPSISPTIVKEYNSKCIKFDFQHPILCPCVNFATKSLVFGHALKCQSTLHVVGCVSLATQLGFN